MNSKEYLEQHAAMLAEKQLSQDDGDEKALQAWDTEKRSNISLSLVALKLYDHISETQLTW